MKKYEYIVVPLKFSIWSGRPNEDYLEILNEYGHKGWRFIDFAPPHSRPPKSGSIIELIFERALDSDDTPE